MKLYCKTDCQCYFVPEGFCHFQTYRSNAEALSHGVSAEGLLPLAWQSLLVALGLIAISATFVPSLTAVVMWPNDNIKSQCTEETTGRYAKKDWTLNGDCYDPRSSSRPESV